MQSKMYEKQVYPHNRHKPVTKKRIGELAKHLDSYALQTKKLRKMHTRHNATCSIKKEQQTKEPALGCQ